jgi:hypothetical protein
LVDLDHKFPILFFPIRIETKYHHSDSENEEIWTLRLRFYPDQVTINNFDHRLTRKEVEDAREYWKTIATLDRANADAFIHDRNSEWTKLSNQYGLPRAAYITKAVINYDPDLEPDPVTPSLKADDNIEIREEDDSLEDDRLAAMCKLLPRQFIVRGKFNDSTLRSIREIGKDIPESLSLDPFQDNGTTGFDKWVTDFDEAVEKGMAIEVKLNEQEYKSGFEYIIVYGIRDNLSPDQTKIKIEDLFRAHRYTEGLSLVKQGTPTNLVKTKSRDEQSFFSHRHFSQLDVNNYRSVEFASLDEEQIGLIAGLAPDGRLLDRALGLDHLTNGLINANSYDQVTARCMSFALWPSIMEYFMKRFVNIQNLDLDSLQNHFVRYVSAQGFIPPIRVGNTPYGILPVTILSEWEDKNVIPGTNHIRTFFTLLKTRWAKFINDVPTVMKEGVQTKEKATKNLLNILSMEAISHTYYVRGFRFLKYITDFIIEILKKNANHQQMKSKNKLLLKPLLKMTIGNIDIPDGALDGFYDLIPGSGISEIDFPMVSMSEESDILDPNYIEKIFDDIEGPDRNFLKTSKRQTEIPGISPSDSDPLLLRLLRYSASIIGETNDQRKIEKFSESLQILRFVKPDRLKALMLQTLDLASYRLDAWISSFANQRLDHLRQSAGKGLYAGAFGWVENLKPKDLQTEISSKNQVSEGGYIQAPSYAHAAAAAVLRNAYLTHSNEEEKKDLLKINLNSERTKNALELINGIENIPLAELLGYKLERTLHDAEIDYLIDEFRNHFPLNKDDRKELEDGVDPGQERIEPRNLTDGLAVFQNWKRLTDKIDTVDNEKIINEMKNDDQNPGWKSFYFEIRNKYASSQDQNMTNLINQLKRQLNFLLDHVDGLSDICLAESVFQAVSGNYLRSGAVLDGMSGDGHIPVPEISNIPRTGISQVQRIALALQVQPLMDLSLKDINDSVPWESPRKLAEPNLSKLIKSYIGEISFWIDLRDESGNVSSTEEIGLTDLGLEAIDLLYIENSELEARLNYYGKRNGFINYIIRYEQEDSSSEQIERRSLRDLQFLINSLRGLMAQGQPLKYSDFNPPKDTIQGELLARSIKEIFQRYYNIIFLLFQTIKELEFARSDSSEAAIENKRHALMKAGFFASEFAVPVNSEGNIISDVSKLNDQIEVATEQLKSRLPQPDDQAGKLLGWSKKLETEGEEAFLESLVDELSGEPKNERKYIRTVEVLVEQVKKILNHNSFLILPPFSMPSESFKQLKTSAKMNTKVLKWIEKASYVRPRLRFLEEIITYNQILESANFSFYCDETKFRQSADLLAENKKEVNPLSMILAISTATGEQEDSDPPPSLAGVVADEWTDKIVSKVQDTYVTFHYDAPNTEAPQCLLLAVSPNDLHTWNEENIFKVILETLEIVKLRAVDYRSLRELRHFLPAMVLNSHGEDVFINLFRGGLTG